MVRSTVCLGAALVLASPALAEGGETPEPWSGSLELSAASASGNSDTTNLGLAGKARRKIGRFLNVFSAAANFAESDGTETQNNWLASYQLDVQMRDRTYSYLRVQYEEDQFSGFDSRSFIGGGIGHYVWQETAKTWKLEAGPGYRVSKIDLAGAGLNPGQDDEESEFAVYASSEMNLKLREGVVLDHTLNSTYTDSNTTVTTTLGLATQMTERLSSKVSYQVDYETDPPAGNEDTDTLLKASILLNY